MFRVPLCTSFFPKSFLLLRSSSVLSVGHAIQYIDLIDLNCLASEPIWLLINVPIGSPESPERVKSDLERLRATQSRTTTSERARFSSRRWFARHRLAATRQEHPKICHRQPLDVPDRWRVCTARFELFLQGLCDSQFKPRVLARPGPHFIPLKVLGRCTYLLELVALLTSY